jgi:hypothetical protein
MNEKPGSVLEIPILKAKGKEPSFFVQVRVFPVRTYNEMREKCFTRISPNFGERDEAKWAKVWGKEVLVGWKNLTVGNLKRLLPLNEIDEKRFRKTFGDVKEIPYSSSFARDLYLATENKVFLMKIDTAKRGRT